MKGVLTHNCGGGVLLMKTLVLFSLWSYLIAVFPGPNSKLSDCSGLWPFGEWVMSHLRFSNKLPHKHRSKIQWRNPCSMFHHTWVFFNSWAAKFAVQNHFVLVILLVFPYFISSLADCSFHLVQESWTPLFRLDRKADAGSEWEGI